MLLTSPKARLSERDFIVLAGLFAAASEALLGGGDLLVIRVPATVIAILREQRAAQKFNPHKARHHFGPRSMKMDARRDKGNTFVLLKTDIYTLLLQSNDA